MLEWKIYSAVVTYGERPRLDIFEDALKTAEMTEAEREAVQLYLALMQRCWAPDPCQRPRFCKVWPCCRLLGLTGPQVWPCCGGDFPVLLQVLMLGPCTVSRHPGCQQAACMCAQVLAELGAIKRVLSRDLKTSGRSSSGPDSPAHPPVMRQLPTPFQVEAPTTE